jgi:hypothetical protein
MVRIVPNRFIRLSILLGVPILNGGPRDSAAAPTLNNTPPLRRRTRTELEMIPGEAMLEFERQSTSSFVLASAACQGIQ